VSASRPRRRARTIKRCAPRSRYRRSPGAADSAERSPARASSVCTARTLSRACSTPTAGRCSARRGRRVGPPALRSEPEPPTKLYFLKCVRSDGCSHFCVHTAPP
jgi:hypothetical protein